MLRTTAAAGSAASIRDATVSLRDAELVVAERLETIGGDQVVPLNPHSAFAFDVEAGLEGDDIADGEGVVAVGNEVRRLGVAEAEAVPGVAGEGVVEIEGTEVVAYCGIDCAGLGCPASGWLRPPESHPGRPRRAHAGERSGRGPRRRCW